MIRFCIQFILIDYLSTTSVICQKQTTSSKMILHCIRYLILINGPYSVILSRFYNIIHNDQRRIQIGIQTIYFSTKCFCKTIYEIKSTSILFNTNSISISCLNFFQHPFMNFVSLVSLASGRQLIAFFRLRFFIIIFPSI